MAKHSFICNCCAYYDAKTDKELNKYKCKYCNGLGQEWEPRNKELYTKYTYEYMKYLILSSQ